MRFGTCALILFAACGSVENPTPAGTDDDNTIPTPGDDDTTPPVDMPPADMPDAGVPEMPDAPAPPTLAIEVVPTTIKDERGDTITFPSGAPHHAHVGSSITLGGAGCPDVSKYAYLLDTTAPLFGDEVAANPLAFRFKANAGAIGDYRVRSSSATLLDWTSAAIDGDQFVAELHRNGARAIAELGTFDGQLFVDLRVRDTASHEAVATACWKHHPMAAPVDVKPLTPASRPAAVSNLSFANPTDVVAMINGVPSGSGFEVYEASFTHGTAEHLTLRLELPIPHATFAKLPVIDIVPVTAAASIACGSTCGLVFNCVPVAATDPRCTPNNPPIDPGDSIVTGTVTSGRWVIQVMEENVSLLQLAPECTFDGSTTVTCDLPARKPGEAPKTRQIFVSVSGIDQLVPSDGVIARRTLDGSTFIGPPASSVETHCTHFTFGAQDGSGHMTKTCDTTVTSFQMAALESVVVDFGPGTLDVAASIPGNALSTVAYAPTGVSGSPLHWDAGPVDLPGPSH